MSNDTNDKPAASTKKKRKPSQNRRKSRELVLKAIYRIMMNESDLKQVFLDMKDDPEYKKAEEKYFKALLQGVFDQLETLDEKIATFIDRKLAELSPIEHAILRVSSYELIFDASIPYRVAINEGVELAKTFGGADGHKYINGVLDKVAASTRPKEFRT
ncbi:MAG: transcription antitermination factor NusB [Methylophilaceae bacterium]